MGYDETRRKIIEFLNEGGISAYDLVRVGKDLCCCRTCKFFVQHYTKGGTPVDFGHCRRGNMLRSKQPNMQSCGHWEIEEET